MDIETLEFALKWRLNPEEVRQCWAVRDMRWLGIVEQAQMLAAPMVRERASRKIHKKRR